VGEQLAITNVEGLIIDEQSDQLAIGCVDQCLTRLRSAVLALGFQERTQLIETVEIRSRQSMWLAFVEISAHTDVTVGKSEQRLSLGQDFEIQSSFMKPPRLDAK
jgi:hypothetical protein